MNNQLFGASALLAASLLVTAAPTALAKDAIESKLSPAAAAAASQVYKFSNGGTAIFGGSKQIAQSTQVNPLVPNPTLDTAPPTRPVAPVPPLLPRAVAPPVGDMSVSQIDTSPAVIDLGTAERIPRLVLRDAPVREVLSLLARAAGMNLAFSERPGGPSPQDAVAGSGGPTISLDIENESVQDVFNYVLRLACVPIDAGAGGPQCGSLQAHREGRTIFVGVSLPDDARNIISRTIRLNQAPAADAAAFLATQGASAQQVVTKITRSTADVESGEAAAGGDDGGPQRTLVQDTTVTTETAITPITSEIGTGPALLRGLSVATNDRLNQVTLTGPPKKVQLATAYLTQLDARRRQVAINVKVVDVNLLGIDEFNASFSFGVGDSFFSVDNGAALFNFGNVRPPTAPEVESSLTSPPVTGNLPGGSPFVRENPNAPFGETGTGARPPFGTNNNPFAPGATAITEDSITYGLPTLFQFPTRFLARLQAQVQSGNAKILTDPTVVVQEGERSEVRLTQDVVTNIITQTTFGTGSSQSNTTVETEEAGLALDLFLDRIDDNGFITINVSPSISTPVGSQVIESGLSRNTITLLSRRSVKSGLIRMRDGQTLMLAGIIAESDRTTVRKVPILGDIPLLGALFRSTNRDKQRNEVIVMLTPRILSDNDRSTFGYGYTPGADVQQMLQQGQ